MGEPTMADWIKDSPKAKLSKIYLDSGDSDDEGERSYRADNLCYVDQIHSALAKKGFVSNSPVQHVGLDTPIDDLSFLYWSQRMDVPQEALCFLVGKGHAHNEEAWKSRLPVALRYLFCR